MNRDEFARELEKRLPCGTIRFSAYDRFRYNEAEIIWTIGNPESDEVPQCFDAGIDPQIIREGNDEDLDVLAQAFIDARCKANEQT